MKPTPYNVFTTMAKKIANYLTSSLTRWQRGGLQKVNGLIVIQRFSGMPTPMRESLCHLVRIDVKLNIIHLPNQISQSMENSDNIYQKLRTMRIISKLRPHDNFRIWQLSDNLYRIKIESIKFQMILANDKSFF